MISATSSKSTGPEKEAPFDSAAVAASAFFSARTWVGGMGERAQSRLR